MVSADMSWQAIDWALTRAPIPEDDTARPTTALVLVALANHADHDGAGAYPSLATVASYSRVSRDTVSPIPEK